MSQSEAESQAAPSRQKRGASPLLVALAGWVLPGSGYWLIGQRARGTIAGATILLTFAAGMAIGGIRVIDVPGYREGGLRQLVVAPRIPGQERPEPRWALTARPMQTILAKPWYLGQILSGPVALVASYYSLDAARRQIPKGTAHVAEFGTLYCAVAGMLNLLIIIDASARAAGQKS
jgi:hypothetical protein